MRKPLAILLLALAGCQTLPADEAPSTDDTAGAEAPADVARRPLVVTALDVGQGDAIFIDFGESVDTSRGRCRVEWLVDAGPSANRVARVLDMVDCDLDALVLSHPHTDHFAGATRLLGRRHQDRSVVLELLTNGEHRGPPRDADEPPTWRTFREAVEGARRSLVGLEEGQVLRPVPDVEVRVLWSGGHFPDTPDGSDINNDSLVLMIEFAGRRVLLTGDTQTAAQEQIVARYCTPDELEGDGPCDALRADVMKVPHHGSDHVDRRFFRAVAPSVALISAGHRNQQFHHPRAEVVELLLEYGADVLSTSAAGEEDVAVTIARDGTISASGPREVFAWRRDVLGHWSGVVFAPDP